MNLLFEGNHLLTSYSHRTVLFIPLQQNRSFTRLDTSRGPFINSTITMGLANDPNYQKLEQWYKSKAGNLNMRSMFDADEARFSKFR